MPIIDFSEIKCKHCNKCVRYCDVKAIKVKNGNAYILPDRCILCGQCLLHCPQEAKKVPSQLDKVKEMIARGDKVVASLSSSYIAVMPYDKRGQVKTALKKLGFFTVCDVGEGAALVTAEYVKLLDEGKMPNIISSACPSINNLIETHYPELLDCLAPVRLPSTIHMDILRKEQGSDIKVVVIGPCIAEKTPSRDASPDAVITFVELKEWLNEEGIVIKECVDEPFVDMRTGANLRYPVSGGLLTAVKKTQHCDDKYRKFYVSGIKDCIDVCEAMKTGDVTGCFVEMSACHGGCVNGPATAAAVSSFRVKLDMEERLPKHPADLSLFSEAAMSVPTRRAFHDRSVNEKMPTEEEIRRILEKTGKFSKADELDCGACGYPTCRDKAIAVYQKKSEGKKCVTYLYERTRSMSKILLEASPNIIFVIDDDLKVLECSTAGCDYLGKKLSELKGEIIPDFIGIEDVRQAFINKATIPSHKVVDTEHEKVFFQNVAYIPSEKYVIVTLIDVTKEDILTRENYEKKKSTIELAQNVIYKQMMVAQEIAGLLGETTAETKTTLTKLCKLIDDEKKSEE